MLRQQKTSRGWREVAHRAGLDALANDDLVPVHAPIVPRTTSAQHPFRPADGATLELVEQPLNPSLPPEDS
ncbi:hypothetical protein GCM10023340_27980 [Nocardioides marinquilinus]|uniref:Uncharacterized protein n=1 Tax=Nocardioides marinquilinus TaxID=1210400 RepID=A0ABP9PQR5_9ACTN